MSSFLVIKIIVLRITLVLKAGFTQNI